MRPFRFRAQAALELRRRQHDEALRCRAQAQAALAAADDAIAAAEQVIAAAEAQLAGIMRGPLEHSHIEWHRTWRSRCVQQRRDLQARRARHDEDLQHAAQRVTETHQRMRSLERLREHAVVAWDRAEHQEERKTMDALAASRFFQERE